MGERQAALHGMVFLGLTGARGAETRQRSPAHDLSVVCNTACSSSVYALHNPYNALRNNEAEGAIVGGVNLVITVDQHMNTAKLSVLSPTSICSICHTFGESADSYGRADAVGAVYLKRLSDAVRDGDPIRGVIRSSAVNSNGKVPAVGITHPNREGQADAYKRGAIGDPLEVHAVSLAMNQDREPTDDPFGAASGLSALIKAILIVERGIIPPTRGVTKLNPKIKWEDWKLRVVTDPVPFPLHLPVRRVSINIFGYGGTNAHVVVEGADSMVKKTQPYKYRDSSTGKLEKIQALRRATHRKRPFLLPFWAYDKATLQHNIDAYQPVVDKYNLLDLVHTLANRRTVLSSRKFAVASYSTAHDVFDNVAACFSFAEKKTAHAVGFVFTSQGAQWAHEAEYSQPLCTAVQVAIVQLLKYWGIRPIVAVGHSSGEIAAAYAAGLVSASEAITLAYYRGKVTRDIETNGAMLAVGLGSDAIEPYLGRVHGKVAVACHNSPSSITLSSDADSLELVKAEFNANDIFARTVRTNGKAYHSHHMNLVSRKLLTNSLSEPTWRNVLRIRDLLWLKDYSLGGESIFPAAGYFAMVIESITQLNELSDKPVQINSYVLRDVSIKKALVTPNDDNGVEVLFNIRPSIYGDVSSVDNSDIKKDHMTGNISINTLPRGSTPREVPQFPQLASGKAWNQALRDAACTTNIKQYVDESLGESRYVLHPATVDSTLQLSIAAIYAGRTNAMDCGVVPIQVDEVAIWPPSEGQLLEKAMAYAWVDPRGIRLFENSVRLTAADGNMITEIANVRTTSYAAAITQKAYSVLKEAPYGEMTSSDVEDLTGEDFIDLALFKYPTKEVVELGFVFAPGVLQKNPHTSYTILTTTDEETSSVTEAVAEYNNAKVLKLDMNQGSSHQLIESATYDIFTATRKMSSAIQSFPMLRHILRPGGYAFDSVLSNSSGSSTAYVADPSKVKRSLILKQPHSIQLVYRKEACQMAAFIRTSLEVLSWSVTICSLDSCVDSIISENIIMLDDMDDPLLLTMTEREFSAVKNTIMSASGFLLWINPGALRSGKHPEYAMTSGLMRAVTSEEVSLDFRLMQLLEEELPEREFCLADGKTYICRLTRANALNSIFRPSHDTEPTIVSPNDRVEGVVLKGKIVFQQKISRKVETIKPGNVEIHAQCCGITHEGVRVITGTDYPTTFSHEVGGIITEVGSGVTCFNIGDRVVAFHADKFSSHQHVPATMIQKLESMEDMATIVGASMAYTAAIYELETLARVREGEKVVIFHGTGTNGAAAVKVAQLAGAVLYVVAKSQDEIDFLQYRLGLKDESIIRCDDACVSEHVKALTDGHGADIVFSAGSVNPGEARDAWRSIAPFGRFIDSGRKDVLSRKALDSVPLRRVAGYMPFDMLDIYSSSPETVPDLGSMCPGIIQPINIVEINQAVSNFSMLFSAPKPVIIYDAPESPVIQTLPARVPITFNPEATYLLFNFVDDGARRATFTFLSRSGADSRSASKLVRDIEAGGAVVQVVRGDATSEADVVHAVQGISPDHPIKGVVHAAMVLIWTTSVRRKVLGAANLHSVLANTALDFFTMTSSVSGTLGTPGQSNYAAANSYLDALARHKLSNNKVATSLILPMVLGVGVLLESFEAAMVSQNQEHVPDHIVRSAASDAASDGSFWLENPRFGHVVRDIVMSVDSGRDSTQSILAAVKAVASPAEAIGLLAEHFIEKLARMLLLKLRNWIFKEYRIDIPFQQLLAPTLTIKKFAAQIPELQKSGLLHLLPSEINIS
ncbi:polyketide synthase dehydratase-domain-containing protein [Xylaria acuta]|nr:polyketide synthase dehydratase-domain-containing protein [Xylaria acuta]